MPDYGHSLAFGFFLDPATGDPQGTLDTARTLDGLGYDLIGIQDHPYQPRHFDAMTLASVILGQTSSVRVFTDVANLPLRPPLMLAKQAATLDQLSGGRFELGLGAGAFWEPIKAMGGEVRSPGEALRSLREAIDLIRAFWSGTTMRHNGEFYQATGALPGPAPAHDMKIWLGVAGPKALQLTGQTADGWIPSMSYVPPGRAAASNAVIDDAAITAGRNPSAIRRIYNIGGDFSSVAESGTNENDTQIVGPVDHWVTSLTKLVTDDGFSSFVLWGPPTSDRLRLFIEEVAPAIRDRVAGTLAERGQAVTD